MIPKRLIIHFENCDDAQLALLRICRALPIYYQNKPINNRRLTVRFDEQGAMVIYHDRSDIVIFGQMEVKK